MSRHRQQYTQVARGDVATSPLWVGAKSVLYPGVSRRIYVPGGGSWTLMDTGGSGNVARPESTYPLYIHSVPALLLDNGSRSVTENDGYVIVDRNRGVYPTAYPFSGAVAVRYSTLAGNDYCGVWGIGAYGSFGTEDGWWLYCGNGSGSLQAKIYHGPSGGEDTWSGAAFATGVWYLYVLRFASATSRTLTIYNLNTGALHGTETFTASRTHGIPSDSAEHLRLSVGADCNYVSGANQYWDYTYGHVAFAAIWHRSLTDAEVFALGNGAWTSALVAPRVLHFPPTFRRVLPRRR